MKCKLGTHRVGNRCVKTKLTPSVERLFPSGDYEVSDIIKGQRVHKRYSGYSEDEAMRRFTTEVGEEEEKHKKTWHETDNVGTTKYVITFYDGVKRHDDGSLFGDTRSFHNKVKRDAFIKELTAKGYREGGYGLRGL
jgi:hypothetical protein